MIDLTGRIIDELRDASADWPGDLEDYEVRGKEYAPEDVPAHGKAPKVIIVRRQHPIRARRIPLATFLFELSVYHPDPRVISQVVGLVSDAMHNRGPRVVAGTGGRIGIWSSADIGGSGSLTEPDTGWPVERVTVQVTAPTQVVSLP